MMRGSRLLRGVLVLAVVALLLCGVWLAFHGDFAHLFLLGLGLGTGATLKEREERRKKLQELEREEREERKSHADAVVLELELRAAADKKINAPAQQAPTDLWDKNAKLPPP